MEESQLINIIRRGNLCEQTTSLRYKQIKEDFNIPEIQKLQKSLSKTDKRRVKSKTKEIRRS